MIDDRDGRVTAQPTWFGPESAPLFGVLHTPVDGLARAGIVICPPLGKEHVDTYRGLKLLAEELCSRGFSVLRFDYPGTGDSAGSQGSDAAVDEFLAGVREAIQYLRHCGTNRIGIVGLRIGALIGAVAATALDAAEAPEAMVLWDPVADGRRFLREQRALYKLTVGNDAAETESEDLLGLSLSPAGAAGLRALRLPTKFDEVADLLLVARPDGLTGPRLGGLCEEGNCTAVEVDGQPEFVQPVSFVVVIPDRTVSMIADWLDARMPTGRSPVTPVVVREAVVATSATGVPVVESIGHVGPERLFTIRTTTGHTGGDVPAVLFHSTACEHRVGSGRVWVDSARELAGMGMVGIRYDRRGTGDTGFATTEFARIYSQESEDDVLMAIAGSGVTADRLMMAGVCSGASNSALGAMKAGARAVVLINIVLYSLRRVEVGPEKLVKMSPRSSDAEAGFQPPWYERIAKKLARRWIPDPVWLLLGRLALTQVPEVLLTGLSRVTGLSVDLVLSPPDLEWFEKQRGRRALEKLSGSGWSPSMTNIPGDHALLQRDAQNRVRRHLVAVAMREFPDKVHSSSGSFVTGLRSHDHPA